MRKSRVLTHVREHANIYIVLAVAMIFGMIKGSIDLMNINDVIEVSLKSYIKNFSFGDRCLDDVLFCEVVTLAKTFVVVLLCGASLIGVPIIAYVVYFRGYVLGFVSTALIKTMGVKGIAMLALTVISKEIFLIPIIIAMGVRGIHFSLYILNNRRGMHNKSVVKEFARYLFYGGVYCAVAFVLIVVNVELMHNRNCMRLMQFVYRSFR